ncbi:hypothetical protein [Reichenbachiella sp.]|uniref:hypothetical protein n=1 Tax=Reichenbachiella sp. TaxID=2184521 RepID=UPI003B596502
MKKLTFILWLMIPNMLFAQNNIRESVFTHLSSSELLVGETLQFKSYVYSEQTGKLSGLSRILYIEILNDLGSPVYQTKLAINEGQCSGSIFVPTDLETGNYQFVAYTRWMKNFDQFFHESFAIINPYIHQKFLTLPDQEVNVQITVEGGKLLPNAKNKVVLRVTDQFQRGFGAKGKIVSNKEQEPKQVVTNDFGFFSFYITPESDETYQLILEKDQGFEFFDLPKPCEDCTQFRVIQTADFFVVKSKTSDPEELTQVQVDIFKNQKSVFSSPVVLNTALSIHKSNLPKGLLRVIFSGNGDDVRERLIWNGDMIANPIEFLGHYESSAQVDVQFPDLPAGHFSISVEQTDSKREALNVLWYSALRNKIDQNLPSAFFQLATVESLDNMLLTSSYTGGSENPEEVKYLPEFRSGIVQGKVTNDQGKPGINLPIGLAFSGVHRQLRASITDSLGRFVLTYDPEVSAGEPVIDVLAEGTNSQIVIEPEFYSSYPSFTHFPVVFDSAKIAAIVKRSIHNQIMNAYFTPNQEDKNNTYISQFGDVKSYKLDDYTRFATMRDTFIELIVEVGVSKNEGNFDFNMRSQDLVNGFYEEYPTLLLLDGAFVSSKELMNLSPYVVERIDVINHKYYFGKSIFNGILSVHTVANDRGELEPKGVKADLLPVEIEKSPQVIQVSQVKEQKVPAFQDLLYWNPQVGHDGGPLKLEFMTSEVKGKFEIKVEGISNDGKAISQQAYFTVD